MESIKIAPTWTGILPLLLELRANATTDEARMTAEAELRRMADLADRYVASVQVEQADITDADLADANAAIHAFDAALDGDSGDAEIDAASEMRSRLSVLVSKLAQRRRTAAKTEEDGRG
jgi:hypothetical protein